jgi:uncharacterized membrane protein YeaQ/YmgE (transglycosylase-associated protein family)
MTAFADITLAPGVVIIWVVVGLVAGWFAARVIKSGYGIVGDTIVGLSGAVIGGLMFGLIVPGQAGFWGSIIVATLGAWFLLAIFRFLTFGRSEL